MGSQEPPGPVSPGSRRRRRRRRRDHGLCCIGEQPGGRGGSPARSRCRLREGPLGHQTLNDPQNGEVDFHSDKVSVADLVGNKFERDKGTFSGKVRNKPAEFKTYKVDAQLVAFKRVAGDSDIHLIVADPSDLTKQMTVEFPHPECVLKADNASLLSQLQMTNAREALETACQKAPSNYVGLTGRATIKGVGFYDPPHHSKGGAPNGIELHPVLRFALASTSGPCNQFRLP